MENGNVAAQILRDIHDRLSSIDSKLVSKADQEALEELEKRVRNNETELTKHKTVGSLVALLLGCLGIKF